MERIIIKLSRQVKRRLNRTMAKIKDARLKTRYQIILHSAQTHRRLSLVVKGP